MDLDAPVSETEQGRRGEVDALRRAAAERQYRGSPRRYRRRRRRRLSDGMGGRGGLGIGTMVVLGIVGYALGIDPRLLDRRRRNPHRRRPGSQQSSRAASGKTGAPSDEMGKFVSRILGSADVQWKLIFEQAGQRYRPPTLVMFAGRDARRRVRHGAIRDGPVLLPARQQDLSRHLVLPRDRAPLQRLRRRLELLPVRAGLCDRA